VTVRCGVEHDGLACDRLSGHEGPHRGYCAQRDEPVLWCSPPVTSPVTPVALPTAPHRVPLPCAPQHEVAWNGTIGRAGVSLVGDIQRRRNVMEGL
jgi:hypothetical protein